LGTEFIRELFEKAKLFLVMLLRHLNPAATICKITELRSINRSLFYS